MAATKKNKQFFFIKNKQFLQRVDVPKIQYIHAEGNYCFIHMIGNQRVSFKISLLQIIDHLSQEHFVRVHKSYIINLDYLQQVNIKERLLLVNNENIPVGRTYYSELSQRLSLL